MRRGGARKMSIILSKPAGEWSALSAVHKETDDLCEEWQPEPLAKPLTAIQTAVRVPVISSPIGPYVTVDGTRALNLVSFNFIGAAGDPKIKARTATS